MPLIDVHFQWSDEYGECYECGLPAAYVVPDAYGPNQPLSEYHKRCCRCAALDAADGLRVVRLFEDD